MNAIIDGKKVSFKENQTILEVARENHVFIPTLCAFSELNHLPATCRMCLVEVKHPDSDLVETITSCDTPIQEGDEIFTQTLSLRKSRLNQLKLLLADHPYECTSCVYYGDCKINDLSMMFGLTERDVDFRVETENFGLEVDRSSASIVFDHGKCVRCQRCVAVCRNKVGVDALSLAGKGFTAKIKPKDTDFLGESDCISCGQCTLTCPVGALYEKDSWKETIQLLLDPEIVTVFQVDTSSGPALMKYYQLEDEVQAINKLNTALKRMGADYVCSTQSIYSMVAAEEAKRIFYRAHNHEKTLISAFCPASVNYIMNHHPNLVNSLSTIQNPKMSFGNILKQMVAQEKGIDVEKVKVVSIAACTSIKDFIADDQKDLKSIDSAMTSRELIRLFTQMGVEYKTIYESEFDTIAGEVHLTNDEIISSSRSGLIDPIIKDSFTKLEAVKDYQIDVKTFEDKHKEYTLKLKGHKDIHFAQFNSFSTAENVLQDIDAGVCEYDYVEILSCPGGCITGGGQPKGKRNYQDYYNKRTYIDHVFAYIRWKELPESIKPEIDHLTKIYQSQVMEDWVENSHSEQLLLDLHSEIKAKPKKSKQTIQTVWDSLE